MKEVRTMTNIPHRAAPKMAGAAIALALGLAVAGCAGMATNRSVESIHQPVVERMDYTLDLTTEPGGLSYAEQHRLSGWFDAMGLRYGDRIAIDDPLDSPATRQAIKAIAGRYGLLVDDDAPATAGPVASGNARIIVSRFKAHVPGCPDWSAKSDANLNNATSRNYGCAVNSNLAAMVANPEHLIKGADGGSDTVLMSSTKAIETYRKAAPSGGGGTTVKQTSSTSGN
jgi:pilus assembly protein CpaD